MRSLHPAGRPAHRCRRVTVAGGRLIRRTAQRLCADAADAVDAAAARCPHRWVPTSIRRRPPGRA